MGARNVQPFTLPMSKVSSLSVMKEARIEVGRCALRLRDLGQVLGERGSRLWAQCLGKFRDYSIIGLGVQSLGLGFRVRVEGLGLGFRAQGLGFRV